MKIDSTKGEIFAKWYLRFNGYFIIDNYIVHAGEDSSRISNGMIGNHTEVDILGLRHKFSKEISGPVEIQNDENLINTVPKIDFVIVEVKTGNENKPNSVWRQKKQASAEYVLRFAGFIEKENERCVVANSLVTNGRYDEDNGNYSVRLIVISENPLNTNWKHVTNILFSQIIDFIVDVRGECWFNELLGTHSYHKQWDRLIIDSFSIANNLSLSADDRKNEIKKILS